MEIILKNLLKGAIMGNKLVEKLSAITSSAEEAISDILVMNFTVVTACIVGDSNKWMLIDTGLENSADFILDTVEKRFGVNSRPHVIILTHGHFDHVGSVIKLSEFWNVPVYIHEKELPYITGKKDYPLGDPSVDSGLVAKMSPTFPHTSINIGSRAKSLPSDGNIPEFPDWKWIPTPGHSEGHISLFRNKDRVLIAGDAITTTKQESLLSVILQSDIIGGPPKYLTENFKLTEISARRLKELKPSLMIPSHGKILKGEELTRHLEYLIENFDDIAK